PRKALTMTPPVHSNPNQPRLRADISFSNNTEMTVMVFPITPKGRRGRVKTLGPGEAVTIKARIGGVYVVESKDGSIHQIHSPSMPPRTIVLE
ncbi:MAG: iduronate-2-sulfatase, partial [Pirellulaceae bacterium]